MLAGYGTTHITRTVAYRAVARSNSASMRSAPRGSMRWKTPPAEKWRQRRWASYSEMNWSQYDICEHVLDRQFDVIIADNVWEHLPYPARATRHVLPMLRTGGMFINITPFLIRRHLVPTDCTRWTEMGMRYFLEDCGFDPAAVHTGSWGNRAAVRAISTGPALAGGAGCRKRGTFRSPSGPSRASRNERVGTHRDHRPRP